MSRTQVTRAGTQSLAQLKKELASLADPERAQNLAWFFKSMEGQYGAHDRFLGIKVPVVRKIAHQYLNLSLGAVEALLGSPFHEHRFAALEILVAQYERGDDPEQDAIFSFYLGHTRHINNWDLVDTSAPYIVGEHLKTRSRKPLVNLARSVSLWERRIAIVSTFAFIKQGEVTDTFRIARMLLRDPHDLIHKAVGGALRETGKFSRDKLVDFLRRHYVEIPRTTLRYAIEHFEPEHRKRILAGEEGLSEL